MPKFRDLTGQTFGKPALVRIRIRRGWTKEEAITTAVNKRRK